MATGVGMVQYFKLTVGGTDLSDHVRSMTVTMTAEDVDITAMGSVSRQHLPGLRDDRIEVVFFQDFAASKVDATLNTLVGSSTGATIIAYNDSTVAVSSTNPKYTMLGVLLDYTPLSGEVGTANQTTVTFVPAQGTTSSITRSTT